MKLTARVLLGIPRRLGSMGSAWFEERSEPYSETLRRPMNRLRVIIDVLRTAL